MIGKVILTAVTVAVVPAFAIAAGQHKNQRQNPSEEVTKQGKISVARTINGPQARLTDRAGKRWKLTGDYAVELRRLSGHVVKVQGIAREGRDKPQRSLQVKHYEIIDAGGGKKALVGVLSLSQRKKLQLLRKEGVLNIRAKKPLLKQLLRRLGCKVWVVGKTEGNVINVYKFGRLNCNKPKPIKPRKETRK